MEMIPDDDLLEGGRHPITYFRYCYAQDELRADAGGVAFDTGYNTGRALSYGELFEMTQNVVTSDLSREELRRFRRMDLALEAANENGDTRYLAVEICFYAEPKGIDRAIANARLLERFTGFPASTAIAVGRDYRGLSQSVLNGEYPILLGTPGCEQIYLYQLNERNIERAMADLRYRRKYCGD